MKATIFLFLYNHNAVKHGIMYTNEIAFVRPTLHGLSINIYHIIISVSIEFLEIIRIIILKILLGKLERFVNGNRCSCCAEAT